MLMSSNKYAFLVSADEIMFLQFDLIQKVEYDTHDNRDEVDLFVEPWLMYSNPIKFADILDEEESTVSVRLAMLYLIRCSIQGDWELPENIGDSLNYAAKTKAGERYVPKLSFMENRR
jgi:hypothetical protein